MSSPRNRKAAQASPKPVKPASAVAAPAATESRWKSWFIRFFTSLPMIGIFFLFFYLGHVAMAAFVVFLTAAVFHESITIGRDPKVSAGSNASATTVICCWLLYFTTVYTTVGSFMYSRFASFFYTYSLLSQLAARYHAAICFSLFMATLVLFVLSLEKDKYRADFSLFFWGLVSSMLFGIAPMAYVASIFEGGFIWFYLPTSMVVCNDIWAYFCGFAFGRTPLIQLSPKKTWEGFIGSLFVTLFFALVFSRFLSTIPWFYCPQTDLTSWNVQCVIAPTYTFQTYHVPQFLSNIFGNGDGTLELLPMDIHALAIALFASLIAPFGGFFGSGFKRGIGIKDFGNVFPGHGGFIDRLDCQFITAFFTWVYFNSFVQNSNLDQVLNSLQSLNVDDARLVTAKLSAMLAQAGAI